MSRLSSSVSRSTLPNGPRSSHNASGRPNPILSRALTRQGNSAIANFRLALGAPTSGRNWGRTSRQTSSFGAVSVNDPADPAQVRLLRRKFPAVFSRQRPDAGAMLLELEPVGDHPAGMVQSLESIAADTLLLEGPNHVLDLPVVFRPVRRNELSRGLNTIHHLLCVKNKRLHRDATDIIFW